MEIFRTPPLIQSHRGRPPVFFRYYFGIFDRLRYTGRSEKRDGAIGHEMESSTYTVKMKFSGFFLKLASCEIIFIVFF